MYTWYLFICLYRHISHIYIHDISIYIYIIYIYIQWCRISSMEMHFCCLEPNPWNYRADFHVHPFLGTVSKLTYVERWGKQLTTSIVSVSTCYFCWAKGINKHPNWGQQALLLEKGLHTSDHRFGVRPPAWEGCMCSNGITPTALNFSKFPGRFGEVRLGHVLLVFEGELNNKISPMVGSLVVNVNFLRICCHEKGTSTWGWSLKPSKAHRKVNCTTCQTPTHQCLNNVKTGDVKEPF